MDSQQSYQVAPENGANYTMYSIGALVLVILIAGAAYLYFFAAPEQQVPQEEIEPVSDVIPTPDVADEVSATTQNPTEDLPDTNPFEASTNPFDTYTNPFDR